MIYQIFEEREYKLLDNKIAEFGSLDEAREFVIENYKCYDYELVILVKENRREDESNRATTILKR